MSSKARAMLAIIENSMNDGTAASFINADERRVVERMAKDGIVRIVKRGKYKGLTEIFAVLA